eukprot:5585207-Amphidinium_carterae.1
MSKGLHMAAKATQLGTSVRRTTRSPCVFIALKDSKEPATPIHDRSTQQRQATYHDAEQF